jgi:hypothetical protein
MVAWVSEAVHSVKAVLMHALEAQDPSKQTYHQISLPSTPTLFYGKSIYTPRQHWNGYL